MQIIFIPGRAAEARKFQILSWQIGLAVFGFFALSFGFGAFLLHSGAYLNMPLVKRLAVSAQEDHNQKMEEYTRDNIKSMAIRLGEMRAQLVRLDMLGERISKTAGIPFVKSDAAQQPGVLEPKNDVAGKDRQGGPLIRLSQSDFLEKLRHDIDRLSETITLQSDNLTVLESQLMERRIKTGLLPTLVPINARAGSGFGIRVDPIVGGSAMHEGIDFAAETGTPIVASAGGVVTVASFHRQYGNMVEIDHGNDFSSRYAHMSRLDVQPGQIVKREQLIGLSGNTGRSTGPHLHFEVRFKGVAQNPSRFLAMGKNAATLLASHAPGLSPEKTERPEQSGKPETSPRVKTQIKPRPQPEQENGAPVSVSSPARASGALPEKTEAQQQTPQQLKVQDKPLTERKNGVAPLSVARAPEAQALPQKIQAEPPKEQAKPQAEPRTEQERAASKP